MKENVQEQTQEATPPKEAPPAQAPPQQAPANPAYCPLCGSELANGVCPNKNCAAYGKKINVQALLTEKATMEARIQAAEAQSRAQEADYQLKISQKDKQISEYMTENNLLKDDLTLTNGKLKKAESIAKEATVNTKIYEKRLRDRDAIIEGLKQDIERKDEAFAISEAAREEAISAKRRAEADQLKAERVASSEREKRAQTQAELSAERELHAEAIKREGKATDRMVELSEKVVATEKLLTASNIKLTETTAKMTEATRQHNLIEEKNGYYTS